MNLLQKIFSITNIREEEYMGKRVMILGYEFRFKNKYKTLLHLITKQNIQYNNIVKYLADVSKAPQARGLLRKVQIADSLALKIFDKICKKHNIVYWLDAGTLLGAIRHKGFIPWDDDIDLNMTRDEYIRSIEIFKEEFPKIGFKVNEGEGFAREVIRIVKEGTPVQIDIFPCDFYYKDNLSVKEKEELAKKSLEYCMEFYKKYADDSRKGKRQEHLEDIENYTQKLLDGKSANMKGAIFRGIEFCDNSVRVFNQNELYPLKTAEFEGVQLPVPNDCEGILTQLFGDYMEFPSNIIPHNDIAQKVNETTIENTINELKEILKNL